MENNDFYTQTTLENLVSLAKAGDAVATGEIVFRMSRIVEIKAVSFQNDNTEKSDLIQEGMIGLLRAISSFDSKKGVSFKTYADRCIGNSMITALRSLSGKKQIPKSIIVPLDEVNCNADMFDIEEDYIAKEQANDFAEKAKLVFSEFEYKVLTYYSKGIKRSEIADILCVSERSVSNALSRIRQKGKNLV